MANSLYNILEFRVIDKGPGAVSAFVLIDNPNDFLPIGGWYGSPVPEHRSSLEFLSEALASQAFLSWPREAPDEKTDWQQGLIATLLEENERLCLELARRIPPHENH